MNPISILIIDDDEASQGALRQLLDSEGWHVSVAPLAATALHELATGDWKLVIASVAMTGISGPLFATLGELALSEAMEGGADAGPRAFPHPRNRCSRGSACSGARALALSPEALPSA